MITEERLEQVLVEAIRESEANKSDVELSVVIEHGEISEILKTVTKTITITE